MDKIVPTGTSLEIQWLKLPDSTAGGASSIIICWALRLKSKKCPPQPCYWSCMHPRQHIIKQRHQFADKGLYSQSNGFSSGHVWMWELDHKESWALKIWCFWTVMLEKTLESPLDGKIKPVNPEGNQPWIFIGRTDVKLKLQYFSHLMRRTNSLEKTLMLGKIEGRRRTGWQRIKWLNDTTNSMEMSLRKLREIVKDREVWGAAVHRVAKGRTWTWLRD